MKKINLFLIFGLAASLFLGRSHAAHSFIINTPEAEDPLSQKLLIQQVHHNNWNIIYGFAVNCPPEKKTTAIQAAIADNIRWALQTWLEPLKDDVRSGTAVVRKFTVYYSPIVLSGIPVSSNAFFSRHYFEAAPDGFVGIGRRKVHLQAVFHYDREGSYIIKDPSEIHLVPVPNADEWHCIPHTSYSTRHLLHKVGHTFGLPDRY